MIFMQTKCFFSPPNGRNELREWLFYYYLWEENFHRQKIVIGVVVSETRNKQLETLNIDFSKQDFLSKAPFFPPPAIDISILTSAAKGIPALT